MSIVALWLDALVALAAVGRLQLYLVVIVLRIGCFSFDLELHINLVLHYSCSVALQVLKKAFLFRVIEMVRRVTANIRKLGGVNGRFHIQHPPPNAIWVGSELPSHLPAGC